MKTGLLVITLVSATVLASSASSQARSPNGTWRCSAQGNIPIGVMTVSGGGYRFQAVRNTSWDPKPGDSMNGAGAVQTGGEHFNPTSGPLRSRMSVTRGHFGETSSPYSGRYDYIDMFNSSDGAYVLRCYRP